VYNIAEVNAMQINTKSLVSITEANQNFSKVARMVDEQGVAVILKNNNPRYVILDYAKFAGMELQQGESLESVAERVLQKNLLAFRELAK
jgi:antitoxin Phd